MLYLMRNKIRRKYNNEKDLCEAFQLYSKGIQRGCGIRAYNKDHGYPIDGMIRIIGYDDFQYSDLKWTSFHTFCF
jgi:hypothetical protein